MQKISANKNFWLMLEKAADGSAVSPADAVAHLQFNADGLLPVIAQCAETRRVLMMAWMNRDALEQTLSSGRMTYFSRSRGQLWQKGETSGNIQALVSLAADCDGDTLLAQVRQTNAACHTNRRSCFYVRLSPAPQIAADDD